jgi:curved DNA-binding protein
MDYKDYYAILGVSHTADEQTIKSAYRRLARTHHPDVNSDKAAATEKFKEINEAYTVLSDPDKRRTYDSFGAQYERYQRSTYRPAEQPRTSTHGPAEPSRGAAGSAAGPRPANAAEGRRQQRTSTRTISEEEFEQIFRGFSWVFGGNRSATGSNANAGDFSDFFEALFGNRWAGGQAGARSAARAVAGRDIEMDLAVSLEEAFHGATRTLHYNDGRRIEVDIPRGVNTGTRLRIRQQGEKSLFGVRGDLYLTVQLASHPLFARQGDDLRVKVTIDADLVNQSGQVQVPTMDRPVMLKVPAGTTNGQAFRLRGLGMPLLGQPEQRGDLFAVVEVIAAAPAQSRSASSTTGRRPGRWSKLLGRLRRVAGFSLFAVGVVAVAAQMLLESSAGWLLPAALATVMLIQGVSNRALWLVIAGWITLLGSAWLYSQTNLGIADIPSLAWPLIPLAAGLIIWPRPKKVATKRTARTSRQPA